MTKIKRKIQVIALSMALVLMITTITAISVVYSADSVKKGPLRTEKGTTEITIDQYETEEIEFSILGYRQATIYITLPSSTGGGIVIVYPIHLTVKTSFKIDDFVFNGTLKSDDVSIRGSYIETFDVTGETMKITIIHDIPTVMTYVIGWYLTE